MTGVQTCALPIYAYHKNIYPVQKQRPSALQILGCTFIMARSDRSGDLNHSQSLRGLMYRQIRAGYNGRGDCIEIYLNTWISMLYLAFLSNRITQLASDQRTRSGALRLLSLKPTGKSFEPSLPRHDGCGGNEIS